MLGQGCTSCLKRILFQQGWAKAGEFPQVGLSFTDGLEINRNTSKRLLLRLRKALRWEEAPVITGFDPRFNQSQPLWHAPAALAVIGCTICLLDTE